MPVLRRWIIEQRDGEGLIVTGGPEDDGIQRNGYVEVVSLDDLRSALHHHRAMGADYLNHLPEAMLHAGDYLERLISGVTPPLVDACEVCGAGPTGRCDPPDTFDGGCPHGCSPER